MDDKEFIKKLAALIKTGEMEMLSTTSKTFGINRAEQTSNPMKQSSLVGERDYNITIIFNTISDGNYYLFRIVEVLQYFKTNSNITIRDGLHTFEIADLHSFHIRFRVNANIMDIVRKIFFSFLCKTSNIENNISIKNKGNDDIYGFLNSSN